MYEVLCRRQWPNLRNLLTIVATGLTVLVVYHQSVAPTIYSLDSSELTTAAYTLGPAHPPGYPLYLLLGRLFITLFPWGDAGYRLNMMSAVFGALAVAATCAILLKTGCRRSVAAAASLCLAFSFYFWSPALMAEVYTLHTFLVAVMLWLALSCREQVGRLPSRNDSGKSGQISSSAPNRLTGGSKLWLLAFVFGLSLGNHLTVILVAPGLALILWQTAGRSLFNLRLLAGGIVALALGLSVYLYLPLRVGTVTWPVFLDVVSARAFWPFIFAYSWADFGREVLAQLYDLWGNYLGFGLPLIVIGVVFGWRRDRPLTGALLLIILANTLFLAGYGVADKQLMFGHVYLIWAIFLGWGFQYLDTMITSDSRRRLATASFFLSLALLMGLVNYSYADLSDDWRVRERAEQIMTTIEPDTAIFVRSWVERTPLEYLQQVEAQRPDVLVLESRAYSPMALKEFIEAQFEIRPIYSTVELPLPTVYRHVWREQCECYKIER